MSSLFGPVGELARLDVGGTDREGLGQGGGLASVPVPVVVVERLKRKERDESIESVLVNQDCLVSVRKLTVLG